MSFADTAHGLVLAALCTSTCRLVVDASSDGGASWRRQGQVATHDPSIGVSGRIRAATPTDAYVIVGVRATGPSSMPGSGLFVTHDDGVTWLASPVANPQEVLPGGPDDLAVGGACDEPVGGCHDRVYASADHGRTWRLRASLPLMTANMSMVRRGASVWIYSASNGIPPDLSGPPGVLQFSSDDGRTWTPRTAPCPGAWSFALAATSDSHLWLVYGGEPGAGEQEKSVYRSSDAGRSWQLEAPDLTDAATGPMGSITIAGYVATAAAVSDQQAWLGLSRGALYRTSDGGHTWTLGPPPLPPPEAFVDSVQFADPQHGWALITVTADTPNPVWRTADGGVTWTLATLP